MFTRAEIQRARFRGPLTKPSHFWAKCRSCGKSRSLRSDGKDANGWTVDVTGSKPVILCNLCAPKKEVKG